MKNEILKGGNENMKMKKNLVPVVAALAVFGLLSATVVSAYGFGWMNSMGDDERDALRTAVEDGDYTTWRNAMESQISEERFNEMQARHSEMQQHRVAVEAAIEVGDYAAWVEAMGDKANGRGADMVSLVTEENFALFVEMHRAMESGDFDRAQEIRGELGFPEGPGGCDGSGAGGFEKGMRGHGMGMHGGF
ncbi:MAG: hypothetical protein ABH864_00640 [archaeon]